MRLSGEIHHRVAVFQEFIHRAMVADIAPDEPVTRVLINIFEVIRIPGVCQLIQVHDLVVTVLVQHVPYKIGAYKARAACYEYLLYIMRRHNSLCFFLRDQVAGP